MPTTVSRGKPLRSALLRPARWAAVGLESAAPRQGRPRRLGERGRGAMHQRRLSKPPLARHLEGTCLQHERDPQMGAGFVELPGSHAPRALGHVPRLALAEGLSGQALLRGRADRRAPAPPPGRDRAAARGAARDPCRRHHRARTLRHPASLLGNPFPAGQQRHPHRPEVARPPRPQHDLGLHSPSEPRSGRRRHPMPPLCGRDRDLPRARILPRSGHRRLAPWPRVQDRRLSKSSRRTAP